jgi:hypothetical protein
MGRHGKIARLPRTIRDELNHRLDNEEAGVDLVAWLNRLDEVKRLVEREFGGREITEKNLCEWKSNGYLHWQAQQEALALAKELNKRRGGPAISGSELSDSLVRLLTARYASLLYDWEGEITNEVRAKLRGLKGICREIVRLRQSDQVLEQMKVQKEWLALGARASGLNERRYENLNRADEQKALDLCLVEAREIPEARELFRQAFETMDKAYAAKQQEPG